MIIKKFQASTETEAILLAKKELGKDAIVMNIKTVMPKGVYRLFRKASVEVTAAVDENIAYTTDTNSQEAKNNRKIVESRQAVGVPPAEIIGTGTSAIEQKLNNLQNMLEKQLENKMEQKKQGIQEEVKEAYDRNIACVKLIYNQLVANEVDELYVNQILSEVEHTLKKDSTVDNILSGIYQKLVLKLGQPQPLEIEEGETKVIFFIGPTGVGKTTTIAKVASSLKVGRKSHVALLTADTYRVAAVEQLRTYANILDIPLDVIYTEEEMSAAIVNYTGFDVILVDTAGRSHRNTEQKEDIKRLINTISEEGREIYLVLSATTKYKDLVKIVETYSDIKNYKLIFTKLDETTCIGNILNLRMLTNAPLSYTTFGQNVPDDISKIDAQNIAKQLLGGNE